MLDVGTPGLDFTPYLADARLVIVLDTVRGEQAPGTLRVLRDDEIVNKPPPSRMSPHEPGLREALMATELADSSPGEIVFVGVVPESTEQGTHLSTSVAAAVPKVVEVVLDELTRLGCEPERKDPPAQPDLWWE